MVEVIRLGAEIKIKAPKNYRFAEKAKGLKGSWYSPYWVFPSAVDSLVLRACLDCYGECGEPVDRVDVELELPEEIDSTDIGYFGRVLLERYRRDSSVVLGAEVYLTDGAFEPRGGSVKNPAIGRTAGVRLLIRSVPVERARRTIEKLPERYRVLNLEDITGEPSLSELARDQLTAERDRLAQRISEIDALLRAQEGGA